MWSFADHRMGRWHRRFTFCAAITLAARPGAASRGGVTGGPHTHDSLSLSLSRVLPRVLRGAVLEECSIASVGTQNRTTSIAMMCSATRPLMPLLSLQGDQTYSARCGACPGATQTVACVLCHKRWHAEMDRATTFMHCPARGQTGDHYLFSRTFSKLSYCRMEDGVPSRTTSAGRKAAPAATAAFSQTKCIGFRFKSTQHGHTRSPTWVVATATDVRTTRRCGHLRTSAWGGGGIDRSHLVPPSPQPHALERCVGGPPAGLTHYSISPSLSLSISLPVCLFSFDAHFRESMPQSIRRGTSPGHIDGDDVFYH